MADGEGERGERGCGRGEKEEEESEGGRELMVDGGGRRSPSFSSWRRARLAACERVRGWWA